jgi:hypothetical protein
LSVGSATNATNSTNSTNVQTTGSDTNATYPVMLSSITSSGLQSPNFDPDFTYNPAFDTLVLPSNGTISASSYTSTVSTGTAPFTVTSTTQVANLNAATAGTATDVITTASSTNSTYPVMLSASSSTGAQSPLMDTGVTVNPSTGMFAAPGGTFTGSGTYSGVTLSGTVTNATDAVTKAYVDASASGLTVKSPAKAASTADLSTYGYGTITYTNGTTDANGGTGIGATLTSSTNGAFATDGYTASTNDRILIKNETNEVYNGVYAVTTTGSGSATWVLTRTTDYNDSVLNQVAAGDYIFVTGGSTQMNTGWIETAPPTYPKIGTDNIVFTQFSATNTYTAGTGLTLTGTTFSITAPVTIALGGTNAITSSAAFNNLSPLTTTGDIISYSSGSNVRVANGTTGQVLTANTGAVPSWTSQSSLSVGTATDATNLIGSVQGSIPWQSGTNTTSFTASGTSGQLLESNGSTSPTWVAQSSLSVGTASVATNISGGAAHEIPYQSGASTTAFSTNLQFDGTSTVTIGGADPITIDGANATIASTTASTALTLNPGSGAQVVIGPSGVNGTVKSDSGYTLTVTGDIGLTIGTTTSGPVSFNSGADILAMTITSAGGVAFGTSASAYGSSGQVLTSAGNAPPTWTTVTSGVSSVTASGSGITASPTTGAVVISNTGVTSLATAGTYSGALTLNSSTGAVTITPNLFSTTSTTAGVVPGSNSGGTTEFLRADGTWAVPPGSGSASNLSGGAAGEVPYQSAASTTGFTAAGSSGQVFFSGGTGSPTWSNSFPNVMTFTNTSQPGITLGSSGTTFYIQGSTGTATGGGSLVQIQGGSGGSTSGAGGGININGGASNSGTGGTIDLTAGAGTGGNAGGAINIYSGAGSTTTGAGLITIQGGTGGTTGSGGGLTMVGGTGGSGAGGQGGNVSLTGGPGGSGGNPGGNATLQGGNGTTNSAGGQVNVTAGNGAGTSGGAKVVITGGTGGATTTGGAITITSGAGNTTGVGGNVTIATGSSPSGTNTASITFQTGTGSSQVTAMTIAPSTNVLIGTTSDAGSGNPLQISGTLNGVFSTIMTNLSTGSSGYTYLQLNNSTSNNAGVFRMSSTNTTGPGGADAIALWHQNTGSAVAFGNGIERMRLSSTNGNLLIGTSTDAGSGIRLQVAGNATVTGSSSGTTLAISTNYANIAQSWISTGGTTAGDVALDFDTNGNAFLYQYDAGVFDFGTVGAGAVNLVTNNTARIGISGTGNINLSAASSGVTLTVNGVSGSVAQNIVYPTTYGLQLESTSTSATSTAVNFQQNSTNVGTITTTNSATAYNTTSDYRLKENVVSLSNALDRLIELKPYRFNFKKEPGITIDGFLAHEVQEIVPNAVTGEKDGKEMQQMDHSKLVPLLTASILELIKQVKDLQAEIAVLKAR